MTDEEYKEILKKLAIEFHKNGLTLPQIRESLDFDMQEVYKELGYKY